uniref:Secreted protein n=1 Tax=Knipowitschia caucasica TaxID=637954 RepID=A0AAV2JJU0_KNICA
MALLFCAARLTNARTTHELSHLCSLHDSGHFWHRGVGLSPFGSSFVGVETSQCRRWREMGSLTDILEERHEVHAFR